MEHDTTNTKTKVRSEKKNACLLLLCLAAALLVMAAIIFCIDPFYHYHSVWFELPVAMNQAVYQTPGAARNMEYDSVIVGTSMTENFHSSWFDELGWKTLKLSYSGARTDDLRAIFHQIFEKGKKPEHVVMDINAYQLTEPYWSAYAERPDYLYDENPFTDVSYLYNQDVFLASLNCVMDKLQGKVSNLDDAYTWENPSYFGREQALESAKETKWKLQAGDWSQKETLEKMLENCDQNLNNITGYIEDNPDTEFFVFYPPYSMLYWEQEVLKEELEEMMILYKRSVMRLLAYENVKVFYFQDEWEIISDLNNYRDVNHYRPEYNRYIFECIRDGKNELTLDNYKEHLDNMYEYALHFDYDALWAADAGELEKTEKAK